jgi:hypothetical protein
VNGRTSEAVIWEVIWRLSPFADVAAPSNWSAELASQKTIARAMLGTVSLSSSSKPTEASTPGRPSTRFVASQ